MKKAKQTLKRIVDVSVSLKGAILSRKAQVKVKTLITVLCMFFSDQARP